MPTALILSSFVAANRIGGGAQQLALQTLGLEAFLAPTVLLARNPVRGGAGQAVDAGLFQGLVEGLEAEGVFARTDLVICGYFASAAQVEVAAAAVDRLRAAAPDVLVVVDPVMGDHPKGLYVKLEVAEAVAALLVPRADWITPNVWELGRLTGRTIETVDGALAAARELGARALVTSALAGPMQIALLLSDAEAACLYAHPRRVEAPNGAGDLVTAVFAAGLVQGLTADAAAAAAAAAAANMIEAAEALGELPLAQLVRALQQPVAGMRMAPLDVAAPAP